ncbi:DUF3110 domain-containing protein [Sphaerospermopsis aphanizomenoides BCCUSP55]|uniref:DUF3110 domain-containing protein n=1 Tax=Sphaerospermopsis aphanizomenoides TaxID=459663 RepID=UPI000A492C0D|nr:DUF3110 domain-containing protein [Sphaerospermopsis aphanizomenoides]MBK1989043.1 DUF3110 domain-containing protein [Sphaerospermopsis aphanizomenoides BCCUSP55]
MRVFVLIFNAGTDNEGIHSIRVGDRNKIMMFESEDDATRFAVLLEAQDFPTPTVEGMDAEDIKEFCASAGFDWEIVPENSDLIIPPEVNVEETDWQPDSDTEDHDHSFRSASASDTVQEIPDSELDSIRRKLEGLL